MADNATRLKIQASVEGIQGFDNLKRSLQGLAQQAGATHQDLFKLNAAYEKLKSASDGSINSMRLQVQALTQLRESVAPGTLLFDRYGKEIEQVNAKLQATAQIGKVVVSEQERLNAAYAQARQGGDNTIKAINAQISALSSLRNSTEITKDEFREYGIELGRLQAQLKRVSTVPQIGALGEQQGQGGNTIANLRDQIASLTQLKEQATVGSQAFNAYDASLQKLQARLKAITAIPEPTIFSPRTLAILKQVDGIKGFDNLKQSLQGLAQQSVGTDQDLKKLAGAYRQLKQSGDGTIAGMRSQVQVLTQLRESVKAGTADFRAYSTELRQVQARLNAASGAAPAAAGGGVGAGLIGGLTARVAAPLAAVAGVGAVAAAGIDAEAQQVRLKALTDQFGEYNQAQQSAATIAGTLRLSTAEAQKEFSNLYAALRPSGFTIRELEDALIGFSAAARNSGATAQETAGAVLQLKQALASGRLQGEELRAIREQAPLVAQAIAREMKISIGDLKKAGEEGKITTEIMLKALSKLRDTQLGKLNQQFNTAQQAAYDLGNAFKDASAELFKLFGPTVVAGLKALTAALNLAGAAAKNLSGSRSDEQRAAEESLKLYPGQFQGFQRAEYIRNRKGQLQQTRQLLESGSSLTTTVGGVVYDNRTGQPISAQRARELQSMEREARGGGLTPEQIKIREDARQERLANERAAAAAGKGKEKKMKQSAGTIIEYLTGDPSSKYYEPRGHGGANYHEHLAFQTTQQRDLAMRALRAEGIQIGSVEGGRHAPGSYHYSRQAFDVPAAQVPVGQEPGLSARVRQILARAGFTGKGMEGLTSEKTLAESSAEISIKELQKAQRLAEQRQKDQQEYSTQLREDRDTTKAINEELQLQRDLRAAATDSEKIRAQYALDYFNTYQSLTKEVEGMVDPMSILQRIQAVDADMAERYKEGLKEIAAIENERAMQLSSQQWQDQQVTLAATLSDYYSQQSEKLQEQNELAGSLAQTIGQGMQQAFSLAIQGAENLGQSLQELGATVLRDIAQQLIQIAVIAPVIKAISGIGGGGGIAPISPGINALPSGNFSQFFAPAAGSFAAGLPSAAITPFQGGNPFSFATGGIMTPQGPVPLRTYARGGIATAPQAAIYGEGSTPEAFIPLPDGRRVPVALKQYPGIPGASGAGGQFESTDQVVQRLVETARQESTARAAAVAASSPDGTVRIKVETTRINSVDYVTAEQAEALAQAAATRSTARQQRALQSSPGARRSLGI